MISITTETTSFETKIKENENGKLKDLPRPGNILLIPVGAEGAHFRQRLLPLAADTIDDEAVTHHCGRRRGGGVS